MCRLTITGNFKNSFCSLFFIYSSESSDSDYDEDIEIPEFERIDREIVDGEIVFVVDKNTKNTKNT